MNLKRLKTMLYPPGPQFDREKGVRFNKFLNLIEHNLPILEIGGRGIKKDSRIINLDIKLSPEVDIVGDGCKLPIRGDSLGGVILTGVIEHVREPVLLMDEIYRVLSPSGFFYIEAPFIQGFHPDPGDYQRFTFPGLEYLCRKFEKVESGICGGPASAVAWILQIFLSLLLSFGNEWLYRRWALFWGWVFSPIKFLDAVLKKLPRADVISSGFYYMGKKTEPYRNPNQGSECE